MRLVKRFLSTAVVLVAVTFAATSTQASHLTTLSHVDTIDITFGSGGGSYTKSLVFGADDGWSVFAANSGDSINVILSATPGTSMAPASYDAAVLLDVTDGVVTLGDFASITNFSINQFGSGMDLVIQHSGFNPTPGAPYLFGSGNTQTISFIAPVTGQYVVGVACTDEICIGGSAFTVQLSGNTAAVPEPTTAILFGLGLCVLAARRIA